MSQRLRLSLVAVGALLLLGTLAVPTALANSDPRPRIEIEVTNVGTGESIKDKTTLAEVTDFFVTVTADRDCAGQFVVTAIGAPGAPPSVLVQSSSFVIGPAVASSSFSGATLDSGLVNDWKISASCHGDGKNDFDFDSFEFFVSVPE